MSIPIDIPTVNYHLWKPCNMRCGFCFATFEDIRPHILPKGHLGREKCLLVVESLAQAGFQKINFAGGEPTLCPWLPDLIRLARELRLTTSVVTNGSRVTLPWLDSVNGKPRLGSAEHRFGRFWHAVADGADNPVRAHERE